MNSDADAPKQYTNEPLEDTPGEMLEAAVAEFMGELDELCQRRMADLDQEGKVRERRAQVVSIRAISRHYADVVKKNKVSGKNRARMEETIRCCRKRIPMGLR